MNATLPGMVLEYHIEMMEDVALLFTALTYAIIVQHERAPVMIDLRMLNGKLTYGVQYSGSLDGVINSKIAAVARQFGSSVDGHSYFSLS